MRAIFIIGRNTFKDAARQKLVLLISLAALALTAFSAYAMKLDLGGDEIKFVANFTSGALGFFGSIIAITSVCQLIYSEIENRTVITLLSKPVGFAEFIFGKLLGEALLLALFCALVSAVGAASLAVAEARIAEVPEGAIIGEAPAVDWLGFAAFCVMAFLRLMVVAAAACFICAASRSLMFAIVASFMACAASLISYSDFMPSSGWGVKAAAVFFPNLAMFERATDFVFCGADWARFAAAAAYSAAYVLVFGFLGVWAFSERDF